MKFKEEYKSFLDFLITIAFITLNIIYQSSHAKDLYYLSELSKNQNSSTKNYVIGIDGLYVSAKPKLDYSKIFRTYKPGTNFYLGCSWQDNIFLEIGYLSTTRKSKSTILQLNSRFLGQPITVPTKLNGQVRLRNTHFDLNFIANFYETINIATSLGIGFTRPHITLKAFNATSNAAIVNPVAIVPKTNAIFRAGAGIICNLNNKVNFRVMFYFDHYSLIKLREPIGMHKPFKNAYTLSVGIYSKLI